MLVNPENNRLKADVTLKTLISTSTEDIALAAAAADGDSSGLTVSFPGEYEEKEIEILGFSVAGESTEKFLKTAYCVLWEGMKFVFLGHLSQPIDASLMEEFAEPDVLFIPIGGGHFLEPEVAARIAKQLEAKIVIPSFYKDPAAFLKALGTKGEEADKFVFKQKDLVGNKGRAIVLRAN